MASPKRDLMAAGSGKLVKNDDSIFDLTTMLALINTYMSGSGIPVNTDGGGGGGGSSTYSNVGGDFTATPNTGAKTITLSSYASAILSATIAAPNLAAAAIFQITSAGVVTQLPTTNVAFAANVITLSDMAANFAAGDTVLVFIPGPEKAYDKTNDLHKDALYAAAVTAVTMQSAATGTGNGTTQDVSGMSTVAFNVTGTFVGTITFEGTSDDTNWVSLQTTQIGTNTIGTTATAPGIFRASVGGLKTVRARVSAYSSGSITVAGRATAAIAEPKTVAVVGAVAEAATASGNPVPMGGTFSTTPATLSTGQRATAQFDAVQNLLASLNTRIRGEDETYDVMKAQQQCSFTNITTQTTTTAKSGAGQFMGILINTPVANAVVTIYDNTAGSGTLIGTITLPAALLSSGPEFYGGGIAIKFATGLTIVTSGATMNITALYN